MSEAKIELSAVDKTKAAFESAKKGLGQLQTQAVAVTGVLAGLGVTAFVADQAAAVLSAIEQWDELGKAAQRAGFQSAQSMAEFQFAAKLSDVEAGNFEASISKLTVKMADAAGGSKEAAAVFAAMGVSIKDSSGHLRNTEDVLSDVAAKFASYKDGPEKAALATELFGKAGRELIPLLNGGADGLQKTREEFRALRGEINDGTIKAAEQFNDNLTRLKAATGSLSRSMAEEALPALVRITDAMVEQAKKGNALLTVWAGLKAFINFDPVKGKETSLQMLEESLRIGGDSPDGKLAKEIARRRGELERLNARPDGTVQGGTGDFARLDRTTRQTTAPIVKKPGAGNAGEDEFKSLMNRVRERLAAQTAELTAGRALTEQEKFEIKVNDDLANTKVKLTAAQRAQVEATLRDSAATQSALDKRTKQLAVDKAAVENQLQAQSEQLAAEAESGKSRDQYRLALLAETNALADVQKQLELEGRLIGATDRERQTALEHLRIELKLRQDLDALDRNLNFDEPQRDEERARLRANAAIARAQVTQRTTQDAEKEFTDEFRGDMRGALQRAFEDSKNPAKAFIEGFASTLYTRVSAKLADAIMDAVMPGGGGGGGAARGLLRSLGGTVASGLQASFSQTSIGSSGFGSGLAYGNMDLGAFLHSGGIAGSEVSFSRPVDPTVFRRAPRYHTGGLAGDEVPAVLRRGEGVFTPGQMKALGGVNKPSKLSIVNMGPPLRVVGDHVLSDGERTLIVDTAVQQARAAHVAALHDGNSPENKAIRRNFNVRRGL